MFKTVVWKEAQRCGGRSIAYMAAAAAAVLSGASPAVAVTQSWNGYHWARTGPLSIGIGNNLDAKWSPLLAPAANAWSAAPAIDFVAIAGRTSPATCAPVFGTVQVCNGNYGANGWLGYANVWLSGGFIVQGTVRLNDYYFSTATYNTAAWRQMTICQEIGHTLGLAHADVSKSNLNLGTCMDYTSDPTGTRGGANGTLANVAPSASDFAALVGIYANLNTTQLGATKPQYYAGSGYEIGDIELDIPLTAVPEPTVWMMMLVGFGAVGLSARRRRVATA